MDTWTWRPSLADKRSRAPAAEPGPFPRSYWSFLIWIQSYDHYLQR
jgi:hypothetical protein